MKKKTFVKLAVLGITNGLLLSTLSAASNSPNEALPNSLQHAKLLAKAGCGGSGSSSGSGGSVASKCGGRGGCGSTVAEKCSGKGGCGAIVAGNCSSCNAVANRDPSIHPALQSPVAGQKNSNPAKDQPKGQSKEQSKDDYSDPNSENLGYHLMTEDELLMQLNDQGAKQYKALSPEGKALAREVASQRCQGTNECKGLNACQTDSNKCAGQGSCKGQSKCAFSDKNVAIKLVSKKMSEKRSSSLKK